MGYMRAQKERRRIRSAFSQYLSPALVEQLAQSPNKLVLGGEARTMTIMFSDVRGFTTISETYKNDPQGLTQLMNRFLTPMTNAIIERKGTIDKYMGDAIMAFWNAPIDDAEHEINACRAALDMLQRVDTLNLEREIEARDSGQPFIPIQIGIGINTGTCVVGNMGSDLRFDYSVLGRFGQSRLPARRPLQVLRHADHRRRGDRRESGRRLRRARDRPDHGQGQDRAGTHLHHSGRRRRRRQRGFQQAARAQCRDAGALSQARLGRRDSRRCSCASTRRIILASTKSITYTWRASGRSRTRSRLPTGTACSHSKPSDFRLVFDVPPISGFLR